MKILIDADSCPVTGIAADVAFDNGVSCLIICDTDHSIDIERSENIVVDKGKDSTDFRIMNLVQSGDIVITHDIKLALVCLSIGAYVLDHDGRHLMIDAVPKIKESRLKERNRMT